LKKKCGIILVGFLGFYVKNGHLISLEFKNIKIEKF
jgi:hypothetical protein